MSSLSNVERTMEVAARVRAYIFQRYPEEPLENVFSGLLMVAAEIAHSQKMSNLKFRQTARDVYRAQEEEFNEAQKRASAFDLDLPDEPD